MSGSENCGTFTQWNTTQQKERRNWQELYKVMKSKDLQPRLLYLAKLSLRVEGQIKCFSDKVKLK